MAEGIMEPGDVCWVVGFGGTKHRTEVARVIDAHPGRSAVMVQTISGDYVPMNVVFDHEPFQVAMTDNLGGFTQWV